MITRHNFNQEQLDKRIRKNFAWLIMLAFAIEAVFGMGNFILGNFLAIPFLKFIFSIDILAVAVYVDVMPIHGTVRLFDNSLLYIFHEIS